MYRLRPGQRLVLASASPRRQEMLARVGLSFQTVPVEVDESLAPGEEAAAAAVRLARAKAAAAARPGAAVLAADTLVSLAGQVLGKPADAGQAREMLSALAGREHLVITGYCLALAGELHCGQVESRVRFRHLRQAEIAAYVASGEPFDKAGAYGVQGLGAALVESLAGSYCNVVGLPLAAVLELMLQKGVIEPRET